VYTRVAIYMPSIDDMNGHTLRRDHPEESLGGLKCELSKRLACLLEKGCERYKNGSI
jgi:hypothetical protein